MTVLRRRAVLAAVLASPTAARGQPATPDRTSIGTARMEADGTIVL